MGALVTLRFDVELLRKSLGYAGGLKIIAIGPQGGKIVGYHHGDIKKPIYAGSQAAAKLAEQYVAQVGGHGTHGVNELLDSLKSFFGIKASHNAAGLALLQGPPAALKAAVATYGLKVTAEHGGSFLEVELHADTPVVEHGPKAALVQQGGAPPHGWPAGIPGPGAIVKKAVDGIVYLLTIKNVAGVPQFVVTAPGHGTLHVFGAGGIAAGTIGGQGHPVSVAFKTASEAAIAVLGTKVEEESGVHAVKKTNGKWWWGFSPKTGDGPGQVTGHTHGGEAPPDHLGDTIDAETALEQGQGVAWPGGKPPETAQEVVPAPAADLAPHAEYTSSQLAAIAAHPSASPGVTQAEPAAAEPAVTLAEGDGQGNPLPPAVEPAQVWKKTTGKLSNGPMNAGKTFHVESTPDGLFVVTWPEGGGHYDKKGGFVGPVTPGTQKTFSSATLAACAITGTSTNGQVWWGLKDKPAPVAKPEPTPPIIAEEAGEPKPAADFGPATGSYIDVKAWALDAPAGSEVHLGSEVWVKAPSVSAQSSAMGAAIHDNVFMWEKKGSEKHKLGVVGIANKVLDATEAGGSAKYVSPATGAAVSGWEAWKLMHPQPPPGTGIHELVDWIKAAPVGAVVAGTIAETPTFGGGKKAFEFKKGPDGFWTDAAGQEASYYQVGSYLQAKPAAAPAPVEPAPTVLPLDAWKLKHQPALPPDAAAWAKEHPQLATDDGGLKEIDALTVLPAGAVVQVMGPDGIDGPPATYTKAEVHGWTNEAGDLLDDDEFFDFGYTQLVSLGQEADGDWDGVDTTPTDPAVLDWAKKNPTIAYEDGGLKSSDGLDALPVGSVVAVVDAHSGDSTTYTKDGDLYWISGADGSAHFAVDVFVDDEYTNTEVVSLGAPPAAAALAPAHGIPAGIIAKSHEVNAPSPYAAKVPPPGSIFKLPGGWAVALKKGFAFFDNAGKPTGEYGFLKPHVEKGDITQADFKALVAAYHAGAPYVKGKQPVFVDHAQLKPVDLEQHIGSAPEETPAGQAPKAPGAPAPAPAPMTQAPYPDGGWTGAAALKVLHAAPVGAVVVLTDGKQYKNTGDGIWVSTTSGTNALTYHLQHMGISVLLLPQSVDATTPAGPSGWAAWKLKHPELAGNIAADGTIGPADIAKTIEALPAGAVVTITFAPSVVVGVKKTPNGEWGYADGTGTAATSAVQMAAAVGESPAKVTDWGAGGQVPGVTPKPATAATPKMIQAPYPDGGWDGDEALGTLDAAPAGSVVVLENGKQYEKDAKHDTWFLKAQGVASDTHTLPSILQLAGISVLLLPAGSKAEKPSGWPDWAPAPGTTMGPANAQIEVVAAPGGPVYAFHKDGVAHIYHSIEELAGHVDGQFDTTGAIKAKLGIGPGYQPTPHTPHDGDLEDALFGAPAGAADSLADALAAAKTSAISMGPAPKLAWKTDWLNSLPAGVSVHVPSHGMSYHKTADGWHGEDGTAVAPASAFVGALPGGSALADLVSITATGPKPAQASGWEAWKLKNPLPLDAQKPDVKAWVDDAPDGASFVVTGLAVHPWINNLKNPGPVAFKKNGGAWSMQSGVEGKSEGVTAAKVVDQLFNADENGPGGIAASVSFGELGKAAVTPTTAPLDSIPFPATLVVGMSQSAAFDLAKDWASAAPVGTQVTVNHEVYGGGGGLTWTKGPGGKWSSSSPDSWAGKEIKSAAKFGAQFAGTIATGKIKITHVPAQAKKGGKKVKPAGAPATPGAAPMPKKPKPPKKPNAAVVQHEHDWEGWIKDYPEDGDDGDKVVEWQAKAPIGAAMALEGGHVWKTQDGSWVDENGAEAGDSPILPKDAQVAAKGLGPDGKIHPVGTKYAWVQTHTTVEQQLLKDIEAVMPGASLEKNVPSSEKWKQPWWVLKTNASSLPEDAKTKEALAAKLAPVFAKHGLTFTDGTHVGGLYAYANFAEPGDETGHLAKIHTSTTQIQVQHPFMPDAGTNAHELDDVARIEEIRDWTGYAIDMDGALVRDQHVKVLKRTGGRKEIQFKLTTAGEKAISGDVSKHPTGEWIVGASPPAANKSKAEINEAGETPMPTAIPHAHPIPVRVIHGAGWRAEVATKDASWAHQGSVRVITEPGVDVRTAMDGLAATLKLEALTKPPGEEDSERYKLTKALWNADAKQHAALCGLHGELTPSLDELRAAVQKSTGSESEELRVIETGPGHRAVAFQDGDKFVEKGQFGVRHNWYSSDPADLAASLKAGGGVLATTTRFKAGIGGTGLSSATDVTTGGAEYTFLYPALLSDSTAHAGLSAGHGITIFAGPETLERADWHSAKGDNYGHTTTTNSGFLNRPKRHASKAGCEMMFQHSVSNQEIRAIACDTQAKRDQLVVELKKQGIHDFNGVPVEQVCVVGLAAVKERVLASWQQTKAARGQA